MDVQTPPSLKGAPVKPVVLVDLDGNAYAASGGGGGGSLTRTALLTAATATGPGSPVPDFGAPSFTGEVTGTGAVSAAVRIEARNTASGVWTTMGTLTMSGTTSAGDSFGSLIRYMEYRANVTAISGTGAAVTVTMGS